MSASPDYSHFVKTDAEGRSRIDLAIDGITCAACLGDIETAMKRLPGVMNARLNLTSHRLAVTFEADRIAAGGLANALEAIGYRAYPYEQRQVEADEAARFSLLLKCLGVAVFAAMNIMLLSISIWSGEGASMPPETRDFFHFLSALIALPAAAYAGQPFYGSAWTALRQGRLNMDVPITIGVILALGLSVYETWTHAPHAYFDSAIMLLAFLLAERRVATPLLRLDLFRIRAFAAGNLATLLAAIGRGGLNFMLVIWLQGVWLPLHGYNFVDTPLWAGIYMLPLTFGFLVSGPVSGFLSDRFGARPFASGGMIVAAASFLSLTRLPVNFPYPLFALALFAIGVGNGMFNSPNNAAIMNSVPAHQRGVAAGMRATFQNSATVLSIGVFFSLMIAGLSATLPTTLYGGLVAHDVPAAVAHQIASLPPTASLFGALLGYNPVATLLPPQVLHALPASQAAILTGKEFFPELISGPFQAGITVVFMAAATMALVAAAASWLRGGRPVPDGEGGTAVAVGTAASSGR